jgi:cobalt-zinc-cadmium efflux system outer membrane protein
MKRACVMLLAASAALGCASTSARPSFDEVSKATAARGAQKVEWRQGTQEDREVDHAVHRLLASPLTLEGAVQIALLKNRELQATFEELSVSQADLVQAGLLENPVFGGAVRAPLDPGHVLNFELNVVQNFTELLFLSARKRVARAQLEATKARVGDAIMRLSREVELAYLRTLGAEQIVSMRRVVADAADAAAALAERQLLAGTRNELEAATEEAVSVQVALELSRSEVEAAAAREQLVRMLGLWGPEVVQLKLPDKLPEMPASDPPLERLESIAIASRMDLAAATREVEALSHALALAEDSRWVPGVSAGVSYERKPEGIRVLGPTASVQVPLFDQKQAQIARLEAQVRQAKLHEEQLAIEIRSEVRSARVRLVTARAIAERYKTKLVPLREKIVHLSEDQYHAMLLGAYQLLLAKQNEVTAYREYIEAARDYWMARSDLERALGTTLSGRQP